ncbi:MAG: ABC transporter ATP-binding protein [Bacillota bacterium]|jgi:teichoic acid transport system ATP-binding protein|nr:ABC transporter ATP-binding protein [Bacillota bacterium]NLL26837.1 ABC transporter ATP-binding protein [Erysipelotrichia bacterium]
MILKKKYLNKKDNKIAITIKNLTITYKTIKKFSIKKNLLRFKKSKLDTFTAIDDVSYDVEAGKIIGIIGKNGSGKSTLLRAIAGIFSPDSGIIDLHDNTVSLLSIGVGFQRKLTGIENIYLNGLLLGFTESEIKEKMNDIIEFADIGDFIYKPVQTYSSGMYSKLAFAITSILETDIILIDEVLSVGDAEFQKKSYDRMKELITAEHRTVLIVSHNASTIKELCDEVIWLHDGKIKEIGEPGAVMDNYLKFMGRK